MDAARQLKKIRPPKEPYRRKTDRPYISAESKQKGPKSKQIAEFRALAAWSRKRMAKMMRCSDRAILWWEHGRVEPGPMAWDQFIRVRRNYRQKLRRQGKDLDGGPVME